MDRRELLRGLGAAAAIVMLPDEARAAWSRVASGLRPADGLSDAHLALVARVSDAILPRTETPGALDVGVPAFVDALVSESWDAGDRGAFVAGLDALNADLGPTRGASLTKRIDAIEGRRDRRREPARTWWRLKQLIVHGYFTSERVMTDVLQVEIMPGSFDGSAPVLPVRAPRRGSGAGSHA